MFVFLLMPLVSLSFRGSLRTEVEVTAICEQDPESPEVGWDTSGAFASQGVMWRERRVGVSALTKLKNNCASSHVTVSVPTRGFCIRLGVSAQARAIPGLSVNPAVSSGHLAH